MSTELMLEAPTGAGELRGAEIAEAQHAERCVCVGCRVSGFVVGMWTAVLVVLIGLALQSCATVCPSGWEAGTTVGHSALFGPTVETNVTISGDIGKECKAR